MNNASKIVMVITGLLLILASGGKIHQLLTQPLPAKPLLESWIFAIIQVPLELGLGIWLISGLFRKAGWLLAQISFGIFIIVTIYETLIGAASCGCFGTVKVDPKITLFAIDIPIFLALAIFHPRNGKFLPPPWPSPIHFIFVAIPTSILLSALVPTLVFNRPPNETDKYVVVKPENWTTVKPAIGKPADQTSKAEAPSATEWPLLRQIDIANLLRKSIKITLLYHYDCEECGEAIPLYEKMAEELGVSEDSIRIAFIELPPYGPKDKSPIPPGTKCLTGKLVSEKEIFVATPVVVITIDGEVIKAWEGKAPTLDTILNAISTKE